LCLCNEVFDTKSEAKLARRERNAQKKKKKDKKKEKKEKKKNFETCIQWHTVCMFLYEYKVVLVYYYTVLLCLSKKFNTSEA